MVGNIVWPGFFIYCLLRSNGSHNQLFSLSDIYIYIYPQVEAALIFAWKLRRLSLNQAKDAAGYTAKLI